MNIVFLVICSLSIVFFGVFLVECSKPVRKSRAAPVVRKSTEAAVVDSATGRRFLVHLEQQMAEFLSHRSNYHSVADRTGVDALYASRSKCTISHRTGRRLRSSNVGP